MRNRLLNSIEVLVALPGLPVRHIRSKRIRHGGILAGSVETRSELPKRLSKAEAVQSP